MFDVEQITRLTISGIQRHLRHVLMNLYVTLPLGEEELTRALADAPIEQPLRLLIEVTNGEREADWQSKLHPAIAEAWHRVHALTRGLSDENLPIELDKIMVFVKEWLKPDELIGSQKAAKLLTGTADEAAMSYLKQLLATGQLTLRLTQRKAARYSRKEILRLIAMH